MSAAVPGSSSKVKGKLTIAFIVCFVSIMFSGIASMLMSVYLPVAVKDLLGNVSDEKMNNVGAYINSVFIFGSMFGGFAWGFICDRIGRARSVMLSTAFYGLFTVSYGIFIFLVIGGHLPVFNGFWCRRGNPDHQHTGV